MNRRTLIGAAGVAALGLKEASVAGSQNETLPPTTDFEIFNLQHGQPLLVMRSGVGSVSFHRNTPENICCRVIISGQFCQMDQEEGRRFLRWLVGDRYSEIEERLRSRQGD